MLRPTLEEYGLEDDEIEALVAEARANLASWRIEPAALPLASVLAAGATGFARALGLPSRNEIQELRDRVDDLSRRVPDEG